MSFDGATLSSSVSVSYWELSYRTVPWEACLGASAWFIMLMLDFFAFWMAYN